MYVKDSVGLSTRNLDKNRNETTTKYLSNSGMLAGFGFNLVDIYKWFYFYFSAFSLIYIFGTSTMIYFMEIKCTQFEFKTKWESLSHV